MNKICGCYSLEGALHQVGDHVLKFVILGEGQDLGYVGAGYTVLLGEKITEPWVKPLLFTKRLVHKQQLLHSKHTSILICQVDLKKKLIIGEVIPHCSFNLISTWKEAHIKIIYLFGSFKRIGINPCSVIKVHVIIQG